MQNCLRFVVLAVLCSAVFLLPVHAHAQSQLMEELQRELDPALTEPVVRKTKGTFTAPPQSISNSGSGGRLPFNPIAVPIPFKSGVIGDIFDDPGSDLKFGAKIRMDVSGDVEFRVSGYMGQHTFEGEIPMEVQVKLPAPNTVAPGQYFNIESSWRTLNDFSYNASGPSGIGFKAELTHFRLNGQFVIDICVGDCINLPWPWAIDFSLPIIDWPGCEQVNELADVFGIEVDICNIAWPLIAEDPYTRLPILGEDFPGVLQLTLLKAALADTDLNFAKSASQGARGGVGRVLTDDWRAPVFGFEFDVTNAVNNVLPHINPPLNGDISVLIDYYTPPGVPGCPIFPPSPEPRCVVKKLGSVFQYNLVEAALGVDFEVGERYSFIARAPFITLSNGDDINWRFRAGDPFTERMPEDLDTRTLTVSVENTPPNFELESIFGFVPRFNLSAASFSFGLPGLGSRLGLDPLYKSGNLFGAKPNNVDLSSVTATVTPATGGFDLIPNYDLDPTDFPSQINGRDLQQVDGDTVPRQVNGQELNFAIVDFRLQNNIDPVVVRSPGLKLRNTQTFGTSFANLMPTGDSSGTFNLIGETGAQTFLGLAGDALQPGFDGVTVNLAILANSNNEGGSQITAGVGVANHYGGYIRNSFLNLAPAADGSILIAATDGSYDTSIGTLAQDLSVKGRVEVYSGFTDEATSEFEVVEMEITDSIINAEEFVLNTNQVVPNIGGSYKNPIDVTIENSIVHSLIEMQGGDSELYLGRNSLFAGNSSRFSIARGRIDIQGGNDEGTGELFASVFDSGLSLQNTSTAVLNPCTDDDPVGNPNYPGPCPPIIFNGTITVLDGGVLASRTGNAIQSTGRIDLAGSRVPADVTSALAVVNSLAPAYSADDLFAAFSAAPTADALLLIDGGQVIDQIIDNRGATIIGRSGNLLRSYIESEAGNLVVENAGGPGFHFRQSQLNGGGLIRIGEDTPVFFSADAAGGGTVIPSVSAEGQAIIIENAGLLALEDGNPVEFSGGALPDTILRLTSTGELRVDTGQDLRFSGNASVETFGILTVDTGGVLKLLDRTRDVPVGSGGVTQEIYTPSLVQLDGTTTVSGTIDFESATNGTFMLANGNLLGAGTIDGNLANNGGSIIPGAGIDPDLTVTGDFVQSAAGSIQTNLSPLVGSTGLTVNGTAQLGGGVSIVIDAAWWATAPLAIDETIPFMTVTGGYTGEFDSLVAELSDGSSIGDFEFRFEYNASDVRLVLRQATDPADLVENQLDIDFTEPEVTPPADIVINGSGPGGIGDIGSATGTDANPIVGTSSDAPQVFEVGTNVVTWFVEDETGNVGTATQLVRIDCEYNSCAGTVDITSIADVTGDTVPDVAGIVSKYAERPRIEVFSGATGDLHASIDYINDKWYGFGLGTIRDANQDGTADDTAVSMLAINKTTGKIRVESRRLSTAAFLGSIQYFNEKWRAVDVVVVDDANGDGVTNDTAIAVLAERISDGRVQLQLRSFPGGALISNTVYLNANWKPIAAAVADRSAMAPAGTWPPVIGVIGENASNDRRLLQSRVVGSGDFDRNFSVLGSAWDYKDVTVNHDANADGSNDDPVWQVLATRTSDQVIRVQSVSVSDGALDSNAVILNAGWEGFRLDSSADIGGSSSAELVISAKKRSDGLRRIHIKDYASGATTINIAP